MTCCTMKDVPPLSEVRHQIELQSEALTPNDSGGQDVVWTTFETVWASLKPKIVKEVPFGAKLESRVQHDVFFRYVSGVDTSDRIKFGTRIFQVKAVINLDEKNEWLHVLSEEFTGT